jgi:uncharacterized membrane protein YebE (DUF533 family)
MTVVRFQKDVFVALAAIAWADGRMDSEEADAIVRAAADAGLDLDAIADIEASTLQAVDLERIDRAALTKEDRLFIYGVACWIARLDGHVSDAESAALAALGERLGVPERARARVEALASQVASLPDGDRPSRYDLARLRALIEDRDTGRVAAP